MAKKLPPVQEIPEDKAQARVLIARDVLKGLRARKLKPTPGVYVRYPSRVEKKIQAAPVGQDVRGVVGQGACEVCAIGAAVVAKIHRFDQVKIRAEERWDALVCRYISTGRGGGFFRNHGAVEDIFPLEMLNQMEEAFEVDDSINELKLGELQRYDLSYAQEFGVKRKDPTKRLRAIFQNIVDNGGDFVP